MKILLIILLLGTLAHAQFDQSKVLNIPQGVADGSIQMTVAPALPLEKVWRAFDGNPFTEAMWSDTNHVSITLQFANPIPISKLRIFWWNYGKFQVETAESLPELETRTGTWQKVFDDQPCTFFNWDSLQFSPIHSGALRLEVTATNRQVILGEWEMTERHTVTALEILPNPLQLLPQTDLPMQVNKIDESGNAYPVDQATADLVWTSSNPAVVTVTLDGVLHGKSVGTATVTVAWGKLTQSAPVAVLEDFRPELAAPARIKVAVVYQNPVINGIRLHQKENWYNPRALVQQIIEVFHEASAGVVQFEVVETLEDDTLFTRMNGKYVTPKEVAAYLDEPNWQSLKNAHNAGTLYFDYNAMLHYYDFCAKREAGLIDEVWVYAWPYAGMYESQLTGDNAFWWNSPPLKGNDCHKLLSIMGLNYERGLPEGVHSFGHRMESAIRYIYGRWDLQAADPNAWEKFTYIDKDKPDQAAVGNIHFPPNGTSDYDYDNRNVVKCFADAWLRYPYLFNIARAVNCEEWGCTQLGYLRWWYAHIPRFKGVTDGVLNNWWHYFYDYEGAVALAENWSGIAAPAGNFPENYSLQQNFPNPFNSQTTIEYMLPGAEHVKLGIFNLLGQEVVRLVDEPRLAGRHQVQFNAKDLPTGIYFYRMETDLHYLTRKLLLIK